MAVCLVEPDVHSLEDSLEKLKGGRERGIEQHVGGRSGVGGVRECKNERQKRSHVLTVELSLANKFQCVCACAGVYSG